MTNLFKKAAIFTDIHFGLKNNSHNHNDDCLQFVEWATATARQHGCETLLFLGDWHNHRAHINVVTLNYSLRALEHLNANFDQVYFIPGNHDLYYRDRRDVQSVEWARHLKNVHIVNDWFKAGDVVIAPWLVGNDHQRIPKLRGKYLFGHFELPGYLMNAMIEMPDNGQIKADHFKHFDHVFTGHFHKRQTKNNITYVGNCFPHNYSDAGDDNRGLTILEWGGSPQHIAWPDQPTYRTMQLATLVEDPEQVLRAKMHARVELDISISYEEACYLKESLTDTYKLRELSLVPAKKSGVDEDLAPGAVEFESVDQIVTDQITKLESNFYDPKLLLDIYRSL